jgi:NAD(P)-dependent dehydrogenase (short-subunit alcohol dehydrogenase family)
MGLQDKVALITGGSQGIGEAIARRLAADGASVAIVYSRNDGAASAVVESIRAQGGSASAFRADCARVADVQRVVLEVGQAFSRIDILVNNAGVFRTIAVTDTTEEVWDEQLDLNLKGVFFATQAVLPYFRAQGRGKVINLSSIAGVGAFPNCAAYCASKGGVTILTKALAAELASEGINVNAIAPGNVATPINAHLREPGHEEYRRLLSSRTPTGRAFMEADDVAGAAAFLAGSDSNAIHGAILMVDDGWAA